MPVRVLGRASDVFPLRSIPSLDLKVELDGVLGG